MFTEAMAAISGFKIAMDTVKTLGQAAKTAGNHELYQQAAELSMQLLEYAQQIAEMKSELQQLRDGLKIREKLIHEEGSNLYFRRLPDGTKDGPYCMRCADVDLRLVRVIQNLGSFGMKTFNCPQCEVLKATEKQ